MSFPLARKRPSNETVVKVNQNGENTQRKEREGGKKEHTQRVKIEEK